MNTLKITPVCIAKDDRYDDSMGAYTVFYFFDGETVFTKGGVYDTLSYNAYSIDATMEQIFKASQKVFDKLPEGLNYNKYADGRNGADTFIGCIVSLKRSRKAPNNKALKVIEYNDRYYNGRYWIDSTIDLVDEETNTVYSNISLGCINEVLQGVKELPFWYVSEKAYNVFVENERAKEADRVSEVLKQIEHKKVVLCEFETTFNAFKDNLPQDQRVKMEGLLDKIRKEIVELKATL